MIAAVSHLEALALIGWLIVLGCIVAAAFSAFRAAWVACGLLLVVAIVAAALLL